MADRRSASACKTIEDDVKDDDDDVDDDNDESVCVMHSREMNVTAHIW